MKNKSLFMGTTKVNASKTAGEITEALVASGARQIASSYDEDGNINGIRFSINASGVDLAFALPVRTEGILRRVRGDRDQARRVAWRQLLRWVQAQLAMIEVGMVRAEEVYVPYMLNPGTNQTLFESMSASKFKAISAPVEQP